MAVPAVLLGVGGALAGLLTLTWTGGSILIRRGWAAGYATCRGGDAGDAAAGAGPGAGRGRRAHGCSRSAFALRPGAPGDPATPGRWTRAGGGALIGAAIGLLLVSDPSVTWTEGTIPALALLPSTIASLWAGHRLWTLEQLIPRAVTGVAVGSPGASRAPLAALLGSARAARAAHRAALGGAAGDGLRPRRAGLLAGFGLLALATLLASLLESLGRAQWAVAGVLTGLAVVWSGAPLAAGAAVAVLVLLPPVLALLARPARTLATALWIT